MKMLIQANRSLYIFSHTLKYLRLARKVSNIIPLKIQWSEDILDHLNIDVEVKGRPAVDSSLMFLGNHISYLDIVLMLKTCSGISFVSKKEIAGWPVIGTAAKRLDTTFIKRESKASRLEARAEIENALKIEKKRIVLFPSGTTCIKNAKPWRTGPFEIAKSAGALVQPFRITYEPLREAAYIDQDNFLSHLMNLSSVQNIKARIEFASPTMIDDPEKDRDHWQHWASQPF
ncbi:MAG: lysophospholipid acyltransferase family protein [Bdellovibrionota bacterium]